MLLRNPEYQEEEARRSNGLDGRNCLLFVATRSTVSLSLGKFSLRRACPQPALAGKESKHECVVVKAKFDSETLDTGESRIVRKGDLGVLKWFSHRRHPRFLEARVI